MLSKSQFIFSRYRYNFKFCKLIVTLAVNMLNENFRADMDMEVQGSKGCIDKRAA